MKKETQKLVKRLQAAGWRVELTRGGHYKAFSPNGRDIVIMPSTPSDHRSFRNTLADLRRAGYEG